MSLYNALFGVNNLAPLVLNALNLTGNDVPRIRDAYLDIETDELVIYTRTGGGNRDYYENKDRRIAEYGDSNIEGPYNEDLQNRANYLRDEDDDYDSTYALFYFSIPEEFKPIFQTLKELNISGGNPQDKFQKLISDLESGKNTPETERALNVGKQLLQGIENKLNEKANNI